RSRKMMPRVRPGVFDVRASARRPARRLSSVDLPTFERPEIAISGGPGAGSEPRSRASARNSARETIGDGGTAVLVAGLVPVFVAVFVARLEGSDNVP